MTDDNNGAEKKEIEQKVNQLSGEINDFKGELLTLENKKKIYGEKLQNDQSLASDLSEELEEITNQIKQARDDIIAIKRQAEADIRKIQTEISQLESRKSNQGHKVLTSERDEDRSSRELENTENGIERVNENIKQREGEIADLENKKRTL